MLVDSLALALAGGFVGAPEFFEKKVLEAAGGHGLRIGVFLLAQISFSSETFDGDELLEDLTDFAMVEDLEFANVGDAIAELL